MKKASAFVFLGPIESFAEEASGRTGMQSSDDLLKIGINGRTRFANGVTPAQGIRGGLAVVASLMYFVSLQDAISKIAFHGHDDVLLG
jgi:hypothetical protein